MKGSETKLIQYMEGSAKRFVIPVYQRNYDWKIENCKQLFDDLVKVVRQNRKSHFFGSIVSAYEPSGKNMEFLVIDGQQRLTTVSLLLLAMYNLLTQGVMTATTPMLAQRIYNEYLVDKYQPEETRIKLKPVKSDRSAYSKLFDDNEEHIRESNLTTNYNYFYERIQKEEITIDELFDAIYKLEIISIMLSGDDNPQLIFESLNSTGLDLSEGDKIRNFILMGLSSKRQDEYYEKYWNRIEMCTKYDVSSFIRDYLSVKQQEIPSQKRVYVNFKEYVETGSLETGVLLADMLAYAKRYQILLGEKTKNKALNGCIYRLNRLETTITRPFFLEVLRLYDEGVLSIEQVADVFVTTENYLFRRMICDLPTNTLNKTFLALHREIVKYDGTSNQYVPKFKYALLAKKERTRFPDDDEFGNGFTERQVYLMNAKNKLYILERLENYGTAEDKDIYRHCDEGEYSIEHIMPQHLTPAWTEELGPDYEQIHEQWLHRIANLTLTAYNSKYSNNSFAEKRDMAHGFRESGIRMNAYLAKMDKWTLAEIEERSQRLRERALTIWGTPSTDYRPSVKQMDSYSLDDEVSMSGRSIARFSYKNTEQPATSWVDMFERVLRILHAEDKSKLYRLVKTPGISADLAQYVSDREDGLRDTIQIDDGIYVEKNTSTDMKVTLLKRFFKLYDVDPTDLVFYLREGDEIPDAEVGTRYELRRKYWTYALGVIKKAHGERGAFRYANPSKQNWVNGYFGMSGFNLCCVATSESARVELYLGNFDVDVNKRAFDRLFAYKAEIEEVMDVELTWNRGDDIKSSKVCYQLDGVSIEKEDDWQQMAEFQAEWSKKFREVIVPYLA